MEASNPKQDQFSPKQKARFFSLLLILLWLIFLLIPMFMYIFPPPEKPGILLSFGDNSGGNTEMAQVENLQQKTSSSEQKEVIETEKVENSQKTPDTTPSKKEVTEEDSPVKISDQAKKTQDQKESTAATPTQVEKEKEDFSSFFKQGQGKQNEDGNPGDPRGTPDISRLEGIISGTSTIGGGLANRGIVYEPEIEDDSQKTGKVVIKVCVNREGEVTSAKYTQRGSTTNDLQLIKIAEDAAKKYKFSSSGIDEQCGQINIDFILK